MENRNLCQSCTQDCKQDYEIWCCARYEVEGEDENASESSESNDKAPDSEYR